MSQEKELKNSITHLLKNSCDADNYPNLCRMAATNEGIETAVGMVFNYCVNEGVSAQTAIAFIEMEI